MSYSFQLFIYFGEDSVGDGQQSFDTLSDILYSNFLSNFKFVGFFRLFVCGLYKMLEKLELISMPCL